MRQSRRQILGWGAALMAAAPLRSTWAQSYPARPVKVIVPFTAGGPNDVAARIIAQGLSERLGQQFLPLLGRQVRGKTVLDVAS